MLQSKPALSSFCNWEYHHSFFNLKLYPWLHFISRWKDKINKAQFDTAENTSSSKDLRPVIQNYFSSESLADLEKG